MATIRSNEDGMLVEAQSEKHGTYYYVADSFGQPCSGGYLSKEAANEAFDAGGEYEQFPAADRELNDRGVPADEAEVDRQLAEITKALGAYAAGRNNPCDAVAYYDRGEAKPWRIADDHTSETFATAEEAIAGAEAWAEAMDNA